MNEVTVRVWKGGDSVDPTPRHHAYGALMALRAQHVMLEDFGLAPLSAKVMVELEDGEDGASVTYHANGAVALSIELQGDEHEPSPDIYTRPAGELAERGTPEREAAEKQIEAELTEFEDRNGYEEIGRVVMAGIDTGIMLRVINAPREEPAQRVRVQMLLPCGHKVERFGDGAWPLLRDVVDEGTAHLQLGRKGHLDS